MADSKKTDSKPDPVKLVATASFSSPKNEGDVRKGKAFETTPERADFLVSKHLARKA